MIERLLPHGPARQTPNRIIVHAMAEFVDYEGERLHAVDLLDRLGLSAHVMVAPDGTEIRCRRDDQGAWHALGFNDDSLGVEVLVPWIYDLAGLKRATAEKGWVSAPQFNKLVDVVSNWKCLHEIKRIDRHSDVDPERRSFDPGGGFPWAELLQRTWG